ncbi:MAG: tetraacyldisaccharide 4'-kinase [Gammaproteobacteria bacterium]|nr:tetraacyldisaccharide 4'-kinase [Gammaproteobacteria bacterium]
MSWPRFWTETTWQTLALMPLSKLVCWEASRRLKHFEASQPAQQTPAKVVVVGNVVVGGSGKTPFIVWLATHLMEEGIHVGIISRGYGGQSKTWPMQVTAESDPKVVGDEPVLLAKQLHCPIAVSPKRSEAIALLTQIQKQAGLADLEVIISDDGLQHYAMSRDIEIVLIDAQRQFGNEYCMPAGPLREPVERINTVDFCIWNGLAQHDRFTPPKGLKAMRQDIHFRMNLQPLCFRQVGDATIRLSVDDFIAQYGGGTGEGMVNAMAGIGNPTRFFESLVKMGFKVTETAFSDHYAYQLSDFEGFADEKPLLMTEKDAVKCSEMALIHQKTNWWYLEVAPICDEPLFSQLFARLNIKTMLKTTS